VCRGFERLKGLGRPHKTYEGFVEFLGSLVYDLWSLADTSGNLWSLADTSRELWSLADTSGDLWSLADTSRELWSLADKYFLICAKSCRVCIKSLKGCRRLPGTVRISKT
jgi:hypothetical protein